MASATKESRGAVTVSLLDLNKSSIPFATLEEAFGPSSLGILIVKDLPSNFLDLRYRLLSYASYLANLPSEELDALSCPEAKYLSGWSHGKEALKTGSFDTLKGSYYVNCAFYNGKDFGVDPHPLSGDFPEFTAANIWPTSLPSFQQTFEQLCTLIIDTAVLVARACDCYAAAHIEGYKPTYLEHMVKTSDITKARLLHYFPPEPPPVASGYRDIQTPINNPPEPDGSVHDTWCATHIDHGCLTGLTSALYIDEAAHPPEVPKSSHTERPLSPLPSLSGPPSANTGLYILARDSSIVKVSIPPDCLAFQTGEALELITSGKFRAVPHFVRAEGIGPRGTKIARNTLAVFTQPGLEEVVDRKKGTTFGKFSREVVSRFG